MFAYCGVFFFGQFLGNYRSSSHFWASLNFDRKWVGLHFGRLKKTSSGRPDSVSIFNARPRNTFETGLPEFSWHNIPKGVKIYQITTKNTKWL
jgi:hypothetical protein